MISRSQKYKELFAFCIINNFTTQKIVQIEQFCSLYTTGILLIDIMVYNRTIKMLIYRKGDYNLKKD